MATPDRLLITGGHVFTPGGIVEEPALIEDAVITALGADALAAGSGSGATDLTDAIVGR